MSNRRGAPKPAPSEEEVYWERSRENISKFAALQTSGESKVVVERINRLLSAWPTEDTDGYAAVKTQFKQLQPNIAQLKELAEREAKLAEEAVETLDILLALRKHPEAPPPQEKRSKRPRGQSPSGATTPNPGVTRGVSITVPPRSSVGPQNQVPLSREPKARREAWSRQLPLQPGRKVAFHPPTNASKAADIASGGKDEEWILAVVTKCINQDKNRYEVQDPEPQEDGSPGMCYNTTLRSIIPLPDLTAPPDSASHLNAYPLFTPGMTVMALYPDTSCFYRAEVIESPSEMARNNLNKQPMASYKLKFEDDDDQEHVVQAQWVVEWPGSTQHTRS